MCDIVLDDRERRDSRRDTIEIDQVIYDVNSEVLLNQVQDVPGIGGEKRVGIRLFTQVSPRSESATYELQRHSRVLRGGL